jgi:hypothetical protein
MIWATNGLSLKEKLLTDGLQFHKFDIFFTETAFKYENVLEDDDLFKETQFKGENILEDSDGEYREDLELSQFDNEGFLLKKEDSEEFEVKRLLKIYKGYTHIRFLQCKIIFNHSGDLKNFSKYINLLIN